MRDYEECVAAIVGGAQERVTGLCYEIREEDQSFRGRMVENTKAMESLLQEASSGVEKDEAPEQGARDRRDRAESWMDEDDVDLSERSWLR